MKKLITIAAVVAFTTASWAEVTLEVQYPYGELFDGLHKQLAADFEKDNPDIKIKFRSSYDSYEEGTQKLLREAITKQLPDVSFQGLNRVLPLYERKIAVALDSFVTAEDKTQNGYGESMMLPGKFGGKTYGLPFAVSLPIMYYNMDIVKAAQGGEETLPKTWDEVIALAQKINKLDGKKGIFYTWDITGNWLWLAPNMSQGGKILKDGKVAFDGKAGRFSINLLARLVNEAKMENYREGSGRKSFIAGNVGMLTTSTSDLVKITKEVDGRFELKTGQFPSMAANGKLPAGGNAVVMLTKDPEKQKAAWKYIRYVTGPIGNQQIPHFTGYMAPNGEASKKLTENGFYDSKPNHLAAISELPYMDTWVAFPGKNGLKITDVIKDHMESIVSGDRADEADKVLDEMVKDVNALLPK